MTNLNSLIDKIKANAVGRCRERIDLAADKARGMLNANKPENHKEPPPSLETHGVTSMFKKRHGL